MKFNDSVLTANIIIMIQNLAGLSFSKPEYRTKFFYGLSKNSRILKEHHETLSDARKADPKWVEYDKKRIALCETYAEKDKEGKPTSNKNGSYVGLENNKPFNDEIDTLRKEYKDNLHEGDVAVEFYKIKEEWLPISENFVGAYTEVLFDLIEWEEKDKK